MTMVANLKIGERSETMRHMIFASAAAMLLLAGCSGTGSDGGASGWSGTSSSGTHTLTSPPVSGTSGGATLQEGGRDYKNMSPDEPGLGTSPTRDSLTNPNRAGSGASTAPYPRSTQGQIDNQTISPDEPGLGRSQTRRSLPNSAGTE